MIAFGQAVQDYLAVRRALGTKLRDHDGLLADFVAYLEAAGAVTLTTELAVAWARLPGVDAHPGYLSSRLSVVRGFARHFQAFDPTAEVPPMHLLPTRSKRAVPYLYSEAEIAAVMGAARALRPPLRATTYATLIGLVATTGMRIGEAIALDRDDVDLDEGLVTVWRSKFDKSRELVLHPSTTEALSAYVRERDRLCPAPRDPSFLVSPAGTRLVYVTVRSNFARLLAQAGIKARSPRCRPRWHDLRHTFACRVLLGWYRDGVDVDAHLPELSTYLGHREPAATYWYLSAVPELLSLAAERRDRIKGVWL